MNANEYQRRREGIKEAIASAEEVLSDEHCKQYHPVTYGEAENLKREAERQLEKLERKYYGHQNGHPGSNQKG